MVKKTKKEKQARDLRKKGYFVLQKTSSNQPNDSSQDSVSWVKKDLIKSVVLALIVLTFQLMLYWQLK